MRVISVDGREVIATDEGITSIDQLQSSPLLYAQHLNLAFNGLSSLQGLEMATQLRNLNVSHNALTSLRGIETLTQLRLLRCHGNQLSDLSWLTSLPHLQELWMQENQVEMAQIAHLATIATLQTLLVHPNPCTNAVNYVSYVVKTVPWLTRVDLVEVDEPLRQQSQHVDEREFLASAASDVSEISLMTSRSDNGSILEGPATLAAIATISSKGTNPLTTSLSLASTAPSSSSVLTNPIQKTKTKKKMTAEDFMRAFPVQDFIPAGEVANTTTAQSNAEIPASSPIVSEPVVGHSEELQITNDPTVRNQQVIGDTTESYGRSATTTPEPIPPLPANTTCISAIASAVLALPLFDGNGLLSQKKKPHAAKPLKKAGSGKSVSSTTSGSSTTKRLVDPALVSFQQREWTLAYPTSSSVNAIQIRSDGSALAKWPNGSVAVSIDRERDGFRCYAAHKDGTIALSFDADGVGFINYYPSGRMMISTSSSGDGLFFSSDGTTILRQWDAALHMKNDKSEATYKLSDATTDGALAAKLSDGLGIRLELQRNGGDNQGDATSNLRSSAIRLQILFAAGVSGIRHAFCNWLNISEPNGESCDAVLGKEPVKLKKQASKTSAHSHSDTLHDIRAAVAKLS